MIPTSSAFKEQLKNSRGAWHELIRITLQNNTELVLTDENIWSGGFRINDAVSSEDSFSVLGSAIINQANLTINNIQGQYSQYDFLFAKVELYIGLYVEKTVAYIKNREAKYILDRVGDRLVARVGAMELLKKGEWTVVSQPDIANASLIDLELYDGMYKLDKTYDSTLTFPSTIGAVVSDICTHCGVTLQSATFPNYNITIQTRPDLADTTYREVLAYMCQLSGNYARFNAAGKLELKWIDTDALDHATDDDPSHGDYFILDALYSDQISVEDIVITGVRVQTVDTVNDAVQELSYLEGTEGYVITVSDNPFVNASNYQAVALRLGTQLNGLRFRKMTVTHRSDPSIEAGDIAQIVDGRGNKYPTIITNTTLSTGSSQESICSAESAQRNSADRYSKLTRNYVQMRKFTQDNANAIGQLGEAMQSMGGMYETTEAAPGGGYYYYLHNKPNLSESPIQLKVTDEAVAVTANGLDAHPTWYGLTVDGTFIGNILKAYNSVIVGNEASSHVRINSDSISFYGAANDLVGRIWYGSDYTGNISDKIISLKASEIQSGYSVKKALSGLPSNGQYTMTAVAYYLDSQSGIALPEIVTTLVSSDQTGTETLTVRGITCTATYNAEDGTVTANIDSATVGSDLVRYDFYVEYNGDSTHPTFAFGKNLEASGNCAIAVGEDNNATGDCSAAIGKGLRTTSQRQFAVGKYNIPEHVPSYDYAGQYDYVFSVGDGDSATSRKNIFAVDDFGRAIADAFVTGDYGKSESGYTTYEYISFDDDGLEYTYKRFDERTSALDQSCSSTLTFDLTSEKWAFSDPLAVDESLTMRNGSYADVVLSNNNGHLDINRPTTINGELVVNSTSAIRGGHIELSTSIPYIDFHFNESTADYTSRIIESADGVLDIKSPNGLRINGNASATTSAAGLMSASDKTKVDASCCVKQYDYALPVTVSCAANARTRVLNWEDMSNAIGSGNTLIGAAFCWAGSSLLCDNCTIGTGATANSVYVSVYNPTSTAVTVSTVRLLLFYK